MTTKNLKLTITRHESLRSCPALHSYRLSFLGPLLVSTEHFWELATTSAGSDALTIFNTFRLFTFPTWCLSLDTKDTLCHHYLMHWMHPEPLASQDQQLYYLWACGDGQLCRWLPTPVTGVTSQFTLCSTFHCIRLRLEHGKRGHRPCRL